MKIDSVYELGKYIRDRRKELGYTQIELTGHSGLSASFISNLENGKETAEIGKVLQLMQLLNLDMEVRVQEKEK